MNVIDKVFDVSPDVLAIRSRRSQIIATNLANADTPHFKAMDVDFEAALASAREVHNASTLRRTNPGHVQAGAGTDLAGDLRYRLPLQPALDGNTVESDREHMAFMDNAVRYQASLNFLDSRVKGLMKALKGE